MCALSKQRFGELAREQGMAKKKKDKGAGAAVPDDPNAPAPKKGGLIGALLTPLVLAGVAFGTVYFLPSSAPVMIAHSDVATAHVEQPDLDIPTDFETVSLSEMTVSIGQDKQVLRIGITLEAPSASAANISPDDARLRDAFMGYLRAIEVSQLKDAAFMAQLRAQLLRRAKLVLGSENVYGVLITDFLVR